MARLLSPRSLPLALTVLSSQSVSRTARGIAARPARSPRLIWPGSWDRRSSVSRAADAFAARSSRSILSPHLGLLRPSSMSQGEQCRQHLVTLSWSFFRAHLARSSPQGQHSVTRTSAGPTPNKARTNTGRRVHWCQRTQFRFFAQPSKDQHVYAQSALQCPGGTH